MIQCFADHPGQPLETPKDQDRKKKGGGKTVSSYFKGQLDDLMTTLYKTEPHFIRCVVPNTHKQPGGVEPGELMSLIGKTLSTDALYCRPCDAPVPVQRCACWYCHLPR